MLNAAQLAAMQATVLQAFDLSCAVTRPALTSDGAGGSSATYSAVATVPCNLAQPSQQLLQAYDYLIGSLSAWVVGVPVGSDIQANDHLAVNGLVLQVHVVLDPKSYETRMRVLAAEVRPT